MEENTRNLTVCLSLRSAREGLGCGRLPLLSSLPPLLRPLRAGICGHAQHDRGRAKRRKRKKDSMTKLHHKTKTDKVTEKE